MTNNKKRSRQNKKHDEPKQQQKNDLLPEKEILLDCTTSPIRPIGANADYFNINENKQDISFDQNKILARSNEELVDEQSGVYLDQSLPYKVLDQTELTEQTNSNESSFEQQETNTYLTKCNNGLEYLEISEFTTLTQNNVQVIEVEEVVEVHTETTVNNEDNENFEISDNDEDKIEQTETMVNNEEYLEISEFTTLTQNNVQVIEVVEEEKEETVQTMVYNEENIQIEQNELHDSIETEETEILSNDQDLSQLSKAELSIEEENMTTEVMTESTVSKTANHVLDQIIDELYESCLEKKDEPIDTSEEEVVDNKKSESNNYSFFVMNYYNSSCLRDNTQENRKNEKSPRLFIDSSTDLLLTNDSVCTNYDSVKSPITVKEEEEEEKQEETNSIEKRKLLKIFDYIIK